MQPGDLDPTVPDRELQDLVADALAAHDDGGTDALAAYLERLGPRATQVREILRPFLAAGLLAQRPADGPAFPERLGDFRLVRRLGAGGMGVVFLAEQVSLRREVALKIVRPEFQVLEGAVERFRREIEAVARLRHPGVVPILAVGEENGIPFFAMELVEGRSGEDVTAAMAGRDLGTATGEDLWRLLCAGAPHAPAAPPALFAGRWWQACTRACAQLARTMHHVHLRGIVHRDLKPSNIMLTAHGQALVLDFGLAHVEDGARITRTGTELGSPAYMSPEQLRGEPVDERTDVYSLAATLFQMLCLVPPFTGRDRHDLRAKILAGAPPRLRAHDRSLPRDLETVCLEALDPDRQRRYASMAQFAADLEAVVEGRSVRARPLGRPQRILRWAGRHRTLAVGLGALAAFLLLMPLLLWLQQRSATRRIRSEFERAQRNLAVSKEAVKTMLVRVGDVELGSTPGAEQLRVRLLEDAVALYERLLADQSDDPSLRFDRAQTLEQLGKILVDLGRHGEAEKALAETVRVCGGDDPAVDSESLTMRTRARQAISALQLGRGDFAAAARTLARKRGELEILAQRDPGAQQVEVGLGTTLAALADCERLRAGDAASAPEREHLLRSALARFAAVHATRAHPAVARLLASTQQSLALALQDQGRHAEALAELDRELAFLATLPDDKSARPRVGELAMLAHSAKGSTHFAAGDFVAAAAAHRASIEYAEVLARDYPSTASYVSRLGAMLANLAVVEQRTGDHTASVPLLQRAIAQQRAALELSRDYAEAERFLPFHHRSLVSSLRALGRREELVAAAGALAASTTRGREAVEAAAALLDAAALPEEAGASTAASLRERALDLLLEAERRGWPDGVDLGAAPWNALAELRDFTDLQSRRRTAVR